MVIRYDGQFSEGGKMKTWSIGHRVEIIAGTLQKQQHQNQLARVAVQLLLVSSLCCPLHAQNDDYISSNTNVLTIDTKVIISAPLAVITKSSDIFTSGIPIQPVYIQAPPGLYVWLSVRCKGGAARLTLPDYVANYSWTQTDRSGAWNAAARTLNATDGTYLVTGLGIKFNQNVSVSNDALTTLAYAKDADNDIAGKATMTITLNWNITIPEKPYPFLLQRSKRIIIVAPTSLTSVSTFRATVAAICLLGIFIICCLGCLNTVAVSSLRRFSVSLARETRDLQECEQNRVFNPLWMPCAPTQPDDNSNIESTANPLMMMQRRQELKSKVLRMTTPFSLMDRLLRARHVKTSDYVWVRCRFLCASAALPLRDSSSDDERSTAIRKAVVSKVPSSCCLGSPASSDSGKPAPSNKAVYWSPSPQPATSMNVPKYPAEPGVYLRNEYNYQDDGPPGNVGVRNENITVGYAFIQHRLAPSSPDHVHIADPNLRPEHDHGVFGAKYEVLNRETLRDSMSNSEVEVEIDAESDGLEFESDLRYQGESNYPSEGSSSPSFFSQGVRVSESLPWAERGSDQSGGTSECCFRSPLSDLYEDVLESCSPTSTSSSPWRSDASSASYADSVLLRSDATESLP